MAVPGIVIGLCVAIASAEPSKHGEPPISPDPEVQALIDQAAAVAVNAKSRLEICAEFEKLADLADDSPEELLRQLLYYLANESNDPDRQFYSLGISWYFQIPAYMGMRVGIPYLDTDHELLHSEVLRLLLKAENGSSGEAMDFSSYYSFISARRDDPPLPLIRYMYERAPGKAILSIAWVYTEENRFPQDLLWAEHVVSDAVWKKTQHFPQAAAKARPEAIEQLQKLSRHEAWWVRLYVAEILKRNPEFRTPEMVDRLKNDQHQLVRRSIRTTD